MRTQRKRSIARLARPPLVATAALTAAAGLVLLGLTTPARASAGLASDGLPPSPPQPSWNGQALTPPMGFDTWQYYGTGNSQQNIVDAANMLAKTGLAKLGYRYVVASEGWNTTYRDANGNLVADPAKFPNGIKWLADYVHAKGLKYGTYEDVGTQTCAGRAGMYSHVQQDINQFASWGVDYLWEDGCNIPYSDFPGETPSQVSDTLWGQVAQAIKNTGRPIVNEDSSPAYFYNAQTGPVEPTFAQIMSKVAQYGNTFRIGSDISDSWASILRNFNQDNTPNLASYAGPGHWNSPDWLLVGNQTAEQSGLTHTQEQSQFSLWAELAAPLFFSANPNDMSQQALSILSNKDVIAIDQDRLGAQGTVVQSGTNYDVLAKPLADGDVAVALFNYGSTPISIASSAATVGLSGSTDYVLHNLWTGARTVTASRIAADVAPDQVVLYRVSPADGQSSVHAAATDITPGQPQWISPGSSATVTATVRNDSPWAVENVSGTLSVPAGWSATTPAPIPALPPGATATLNWTVTPPASAQLGLTQLQATAAYSVGTERNMVTGPQTVVVGQQPTVGTATLDTSTQGNWIGKYGTQGYDIAGSGSQLPTGVSVDTSGANFFAGYNTSGDIRFLQDPGGSGRANAVWYGGSQGSGFSIGINVSGTQARRVSLYLLDPDGVAAGVPRKETLTIEDPLGNTLKTIDPGSIANGVYVSFSLTGDAKVTINDITGSNAVVSGVFIDPPG